MLDYHGFRFISLKQFLQVCHNFPDIIVGDLRTPACPDTVSTVHQNHRNYGSVVLGFYFQVVVVQGVEQGFIVDVEQDSCQWTGEKEFLIILLNVT